MTFQEWQATRKAKDDLEEFCGYEAAGHEYEGGYVIVAGGRFHVQIECSERDFATLAEAEAYLWAEWCDAEINGGAS